MTKGVAVSFNALQGTWPLDTLPWVSAELESLVLQRNSFAGAWPGQGLRRLYALRELTIGDNQFTGMWPGNGLTQRVAALMKFDVRINFFTGNFPLDCLGHWTALVVFDVYQNSFAGTVSTPGSGGRYLQRVDVYWNLFAGTWPADGLAHAANLQSLSLQKNRFTGSWPVNALQSSSALHVIHLQQNKFTGTWSENALHRNVGEALIHFSIGINDFHGTWACEPLARLTSLRDFKIGKNRFQGTWPERALNRLSSMEYLQLGPNGFEGVLATTWPPRLATLILHKTCFEGALPDAFSQLTRLESLKAGGNSFEGSLPKNVAARQPHLHLFSVRHLMLEGNVPESLGQMTRLNSSLILGYGHGGPIPGFTGTMLALSGFRNNFDGHLPNMHLASWSYLVIHSNLLTCKLPHHYGVRPALALALIANRFTQPQLYPRWVFEHERGDLFLVTHKFFVSLLVKALLGSWTTLGLIAWRSSIGAKRSQGATPVLYGRYFLLRAAYGHSFRTLATNICFTFTLVLAYIRSHAPACSAILERLRIPCVRPPVWLPMLLESACALRLACALAALQRFVLWLHPEQDPTQFQYPPSQPGRRIQLGQLRRPDRKKRRSPIYRRQRTGRSPSHPHLRKKRSPVYSSSSPLSKCRSPRRRIRSTANFAGVKRCRKRANVTARWRQCWHSCSVWGVWLLLSCCISAPGALYAMLKAVPGILRGSQFISFLVTQLVALLTHIFSDGVLPVLARHVQRREILKEELTGVANLLSLPLLPCSVTLIFSEDCLGQWSRLWQPCVKQPSPLDALEHVPIPYLTGTLEPHLHYVQEKLVKRDALCERGLMDTPRCVNAVLQRGMLLLLGSALHTTFTGPALRIVLMRRMRLGAAWVHLARLWSLTLIFSAPIPLLSVFMAGSLFIYLLLLFGDLALLRQDNVCATDVDERMPQISMSMAKLSAFALQLGFVAVVYSGG